MQTQVFSQDNRNRVESAKICTIGFSQWIFLRSATDTEREQREAFPIVEGNGRLIHRKANRPLALSLNYKRHRYGCAIENIPQ
jgi:hypothetical protein